jgi:hypothetical protein
MLLQELFQKQYPVKTPQQLKDDPRVGKKIGMGSFGAAYVDNTNSANVIKIGRQLSGTNPEKDGFLVYINKIKNMKVPVFPQIHYMQIYQYDDKHPMLDDGEEKINWCYEIGMERLYGAESLSKEEWLHLLRQLYYPHDVSRLEEYDKNELMNTYASKLQILVYYKFIEISDDNYNTIKIPLNEIGDQYLRIAVRAIRGLQKRFNLDLHSGNFMFRKTPYGPQLVIIDPLSYARY